ncbi:MAG: phosphoglycolate phosphatase, partial [Tenericutes bacterium 4572_104]
DSIAAGYGFGTEEEIEKIAPTFVAENIKQLKELLGLTNK